MPLIWPAWLSPDAPVAVLVRDAGQPEIEDLDLDPAQARAAEALPPVHGLIGDQDVGGFQIAMDHPALMGVADRLANLEKQFQPSPDGYWAPACP